MAARDVTALAELLVAVVGMVGVVLAITLVVGYTVRFITRKRWTHTAMVKAALVVALGWAALAVLMYAWMALSVY